MSASVVPGSLPGIRSAVESVEAQVWWGREEQLVRKSDAQIAAATVDSGASPTTALRGGLVMGIITATGLWTQYSPTATDGSETARGVLPRSLSMLDETGTAAIRYVPGGILIGGCLKANELIGLDGTARKHLAQNFIFDDDPMGRGWFAPNRREINKAASYTVVAADTGTLFTMSAVATFTLPTLAKGLSFEFLSTAAATMTITSAAGNDIVCYGDAAASSIAFSTGGQQIGARARIESNAAGDKWLFSNLGGCVATPT